MLLFSVWRSQLVLENAVERAPEKGVRYYGRPSGALVT